jgi:hypothetical protein
MAVGYTSVGFIGLLGTIVTGIVIIVFIIVIVKLLTEWIKNNNSPKLIVDAYVVAKRTNVSHSHHAHAGDMTGAHGYSTRTSTTYYVTFQVESGDRFELNLRGGEYALLAEGDYGKLSFQGTRYLGFERQ